jgi:hypothetical protein
MKIFPFHLDAWKNILTYGECAVNFANQFRYAEATVAAALTREGAKSMLRSLFTEHPASVHETYGEHMVVAGGFGVRMIVGGLACLVHALLPFLFERTASRVIAALNERMVTNRVRPARLSGRELAAGPGR